MMRQDAVFSVLLFAAVGFLDAYTLPLDFISTEQELQPIELGSVLQNGQLPCFPGTPYMNMVNKRQEAADCVGEHCGLNADAVVEPTTIDNQLVKWNYPSGNQEEPLEFALKQNFGNGNDALSDGNENWNKAIPNRPAYNPTKEILPSGSIGYLDLGEATNPDGRADGTLDDYFEAAAPKKSPAPPAPIDQDSKTGQPIENSCLVPPHGQQNAYLVHFVEVRTAVTPRNPQGILVSQYAFPVRNYYDVAVGQNNTPKYRKRANFVFLSGGKIMPLRRYEPRGWLVSPAGEPAEAALEWFESLAEGVAPSRPTQMSLNPPNITGVWVSRVFDALKNSGSPYWVPI